MEHLDVGSLFLSVCLILFARVCFRSFVGIYRSLGLIRGDLITDTRTYETFALHLSAPSLPAADWILIRELSQSDERLRRPARRPAGPDRRPNTLSHSLGQSSDRRFEIGNIDRYVHSFR